MSGLRQRMNRLLGADGMKDKSDVEELSPLDRLVKEPTDDQMTDEEGEQLSPIWSTFGVKLCTNEYGSFLLRETLYPLSYRHGLHAFDELHKGAIGLQAFHPAYSELAAEDILFLDLETTGLGVGAGNVPFMVGIGYIGEDGFAVEQMLIRHPAEEYAMLHYLVKKLSKYTFLATYNGKTFDWPLVQNRFIMNGLGRHIWEPRHLDFLHPARSVWRNTLVSCKLSHVEEERLGIMREEDVPGSLAPQLYFQYLADGDPAPLEGVFRHNETDLLSLACLAIRFGHLLNGDLSEFIPLPTEPEELIRTGLWLEKMGKHEFPEQLFRYAIQDERASSSSLLMLAARDKKAGNWGRAVLLWQKAIIYSQHHYGSASQEACIELAMYYEHKLKDFQSAMQYASIALEHAVSHPYKQRHDAKRRAELDAIHNRIARLQRKLG